SRWKAENHAKLEIIQFSVIICVCEQVVFEKKSRQITRFQFWRDYFRVFISNGSFRVQKCHAKMKNMRFSVRI
ncbi:MAG: hypothetical protein IJG86_09760, partial [Clostridia bacterium]|nr:hypothetical protein [Clostridia bacterium]